MVTSDEAGYSYTTADRRGWGWTASCGESKPESVFPIFFWTRENKIVPRITNQDQFQEERRETYYQGITRKVSFPHLREAPNPSIVLFFYCSILYHMPIYSSLNPTALLSSTARFWQKIYRHAVWKYITFFSKQRQEGSKIVISCFTSLFPPPLPSSSMLVSCWLLCLYRCTFLPPFSASLPHLPFLFSHLFSLTTF